MGFWIAVVLPFFFFFLRGALFFFWRDGVCRMTIPVVPCIQIISPCGFHPAGARSRYGSYYVHLLLRCTVLYHFNDNRAVSWYWKIRDSYVEKKTPPQPPRKTPPSISRSPSRKQKKKEGVIFFSCGGACCLLLSFVVVECFLSIFVFFVRFERKKPIGIKQQGRQWSSNQLVITATAVR